MEADEEASEDYDLDDDGHLRNAVIQHIIDSDYSTRLANAPFSLKDAKLVPAAGSCDACPKRSGNQPMLFAKEDPKDSCGDIPCYRSKIAAYVEREKQRVVAAGGRVAQDEESRRIFNGGSHLPWNSDWVHLDAICYEDEKKRTYRKLLGDHCPSAVLAFNSLSSPFLLALKKDVLAALQAAGVKFRGQELEDGQPSTPRAHGAAHHDDPEGEEEEPQEDDLEDLPPDHPNSAERRGNTDPRAAAYEGRVRAAALQRIVGAIVAAAEASPLDDNRFAELVLATMLRGGYSNSTSDAFKRRELKLEPGQEDRQGYYSVYSEREKALRELAKTLAPGQLRGLILELAIGRSGSYVGGSDYSDAVKAAMAAYGIDPAPIEKATMEEFEAKRAARRPKAKAGGAA
jgi:ParB family chromosome partitioning protein